MFACSANMNCILAAWGREKLSRGLVETQGGRDGRREGESALEKEVYMKRWAKEAAGPGGVEEQLLSAAPLRTSVHATGTSHWLILQHSSCLKHKAHTSAHSKSRATPAVIYILQRSITPWTQKLHFTVWPFCEDAALIPVYFPIFCATLLRSTR